MTKRALVIAAHPDDEVLGCGGTMALLAEQGAEVHVAFLADGVFSREAGQGSELEARRSAARRACDVLGATVTFGDFADNRMDGVPLLDVVKPIEAMIAQHRPDLVLTHHVGDVNVDHRQIHRAVVTACRPQSHHPVRTLLFFEIASSTEWQPPSSGPAFAPNWFVDVSTTIDRKLAALDEYAMELRPWPHPRSRAGVEHLARWRGATIGADAAEAFMLGRQLT